MHLYPDISSLASPLRESSVVQEIKRLAIESYPQEFGALILTDGRVIPLENKSDDEEHMLEIDPKVWVFYHKQILAVVHSHPNGPAHPSSTDMKFQMDTGVIVGLVVCGEDWCGDPFWWGDGVPIPPLIGRHFRHGPSGSDGKGDCYALIKDFYETCRNVKIPEFPRDWDWWSTGNLYLEGFPKAGFRPISVEEAIPGDVFLASVRSEVPNHGGILWDNGVVLHHLMDRLSARTAYGPWSKYVTNWLRYEGDIPPWNPKG